MKLSELNEGFLRKQLVGLAGLKRRISEVLKIKRGALASYRGVGDGPDMKWVLAWTLPYNRLDDEELMHKLFQNTIQREAGTFFKDFDIQSSKLQNGIVFVTLTANDPIAVNT